MRFFPKIRTLIFLFENVQAYKVKLTAENGITHSNDEKSALAL